MRDWRTNLQWGIMDTYILRKFIGSVFFSIALLMTIIIVFDISEKIQSFMDNEIPLGIIVVKYYFNFIPYFVNLFFPLFTFISVIWFTSKLSGWNEIISFFNGGISFYRFLVPYIVGALLLCILSMFMSNFVIPKTNAGMYNFKEVYMHKNHSITTSNIHFKNSKYAYVYAQRWRKQTMDGDMFTYEIIGPERIEYKIRSESIQYNESTKKWTLYNYVIRDFSGEKEVLRMGGQMDTTFNFLPEDFNADETVAETMSYSELKKFIAKEQSKGSSLVKIYQIEWQKRLANPASIVVMTLLGLCVAARRTRRGVGVHIFIGLLFVFMFIFLQQVSTVFAISESLSPMMAIWLPNLIYLFICAGMLYAMPK